MPPTVPREKGKSKLDVGQEIEYLQHLFSLMWRSGEIARFIKFAAVGGRGVLVNEGLLALLHYAGTLDYRFALFIAAETAVISNFILNHYFTFADLRGVGVKSFVKKLSLFDLISQPGVALNIGITVLITEVGNNPYLLAVNLVGILAAMLWNFFANNMWTWKR